MIGMQDAFGDDDQTVNPLSSHRPVSDVTPPKSGPFGSTIGIHPDTLLEDCMMVKAIWITPPSDGVTECVSLEMVVSSPKAYARIFSTARERVEWGWVVHETAVCVWRNPSFLDDADV